MTIVLRNNLIHFQKWLTMTKVHQKQLSTKSMLCWILSRKASSGAMLRPGPSGQDKSAPLSRHRRGQQKELCFMVQSYQPNLLFYCGKLFKFCPTLLVLYNQLYIEGVCHKNFVCVANMMYFKQEQVF